MASSYTFDVLKAAILNRMKRIDICAGYQQALLATTRSQLIAAAADLIMWCYRSGIVDDFLLSQFTDIELNAYGIYAGAAVITNPDMDIYLLANADAVITINGTTQARLFLGGNASAEIITAAYAYVEVTAHESSEVHLTMSSYSIVKLVASQTASLSITAGNTTVMHVRMTDNSSLRYYGNDSSFALIKAYNQSRVNYTAAYPAVIDLQKFNGAVVTETPPISDIES